MTGIVFATMLQVDAVVDDTSMKALLCLALPLRFSSLQICITVSSLWCCRPRSIDCLVVPSKQELRPLLQHVQKHVPQLLATYGKDKASRASMSSRRSSASVVAQRPNTQPTRHVHAAHVPSTAHATARATAEVPQRHSSVYRSDASQTANGGITALASMAVAPAVARTSQHDSHQSVAAATSGYSTAAAPTHAYTGKARLPLVTDAQWFKDKNYDNMSQNGLEQLEKEDWIQMGKRLEVNVYDNFDQHASCLKHTWFAFHTCYSMQQTAACVCCSSILLMGASQGAPKGSSTL